MLLELQRSFRRGIVEGDPAALALVDAAPEVARGRLGIHAANVVLSLTEVLETAFPVVRRLVGPEFFRAAAAVFIRRHPPARPQLSAYGDGFADFLAGFPPAASLPYLPDVARLEWARIEAYFAAGSAGTLDALALAAVPPEAVLGLRFRLHPSLRLIASPFPIVAIWEANQPSHAEVPTVDLSQPERARVLRPGALVRVEALDAGRFAFLTALAAARLEDAIAAATAADGAFVLEAALLAELSAGSIVGFVEEDRP